jgi:hypothetical protein
VCIWENSIKIDHNIKIDNSFFETTEEFKYLGATKTYQNSFEEDRKSGNAGYHSVQNLMSSSLLSKKLIYTELYFFLLFCMGVKLRRSH